MLLKRSNYSFEDFSVKTRQDPCKIIFDTNMLTLELISNNNNKIIQFNVNNLLVGRMNLDNQKIEIIENKYRKFENDIYDDANCIRIEDEDNHFRIGYSLNTNASELSLKIYFFDSKRELHEGEFVFDISCD